MLRNTNQQRHQAAFAHFRTAAGLSAVAMPPIDSLAPEKEVATLIATAALSAIMITLSTTDDGRRSWILTKGARTVEVTTLDGLRDGIVEMRGV